MLPDSVPADQTSPHFLDSLPLLRAADTSQKPIKVESNPIGASETSELNNIDEQAAQPSDSLFESERPTDFWTPGADMSLFLTLLMASIIFCGAPFSQAGLLDPYELNVLDLARRMAIHLHGASHLTLTGVNNTLPHLNDLGQPQLPFSSIALSLSLFGLHDWSGRLPLSLWGFLGVGACFAFVSNLVDRRAALLSSLVLISFPLYLVQSYTMIGEICIMASLAISFGGLAVATFGAAPAPKRLIWFVWGAFGLFLGVESRGGLLGVAVPCLAIGLSWLLMQLSYAEPNPESAEYTAKTPPFWRRVACFDRLSHAVGFCSLVLGVSVFAYGVMVLWRGPKDLQLVVGQVLKTPNKYQTFDLYLGKIGYALAPWSAFIPLAIGRLFSKPYALRGLALSRESAFRAALLFAASICFSMHTFLAFYAPPITFSGVVFLAVACGLALRDYERGAPSSLALSVVTLVFLGLILHDLIQIPEKTFEAFGAPIEKFPESFTRSSTQTWSIFIASFGVLTALTWFEKDRGSDLEKEHLPFDTKRYRLILTRIRSVGEGGLVYFYYALVASSAMVALALFFGSKYGFSFAKKIGGNANLIGVNLWWILSLIPLVLLIGIPFITDIWLWAFGYSKRLSKQSWTRGKEPFFILFQQAFPPKEKQKESNNKSETVRGSSVFRESERLIALLLMVCGLIFAVPVGVYVGLTKMSSLPLLARVLVALPSGIFLFFSLGLMGDLFNGSRAAFFAFAGALFGVIVNLSYYPALANQLSPKGVFSTFQTVHRPSEELGLLGVGARAADYYGINHLTRFSDPHEAYRWLTAAQGAEQDKLNRPRRYLATRGEDLAELNFLHRKSWLPNAKNLPILDGRSSQIMLATSELFSGEKNENFFEQMVLSSVPDIQRKLEVNLDDKLIALGLQIEDQTHKRVESVAVGKHYHIKFYYRVKAPIDTEWEAFVHIDGQNRRHNGDHKPCGGKYRMRYWLPGDVIVDDYDLVLEANFSGSEYAIRYGFWMGDSRMKILSGPSDGDNRINGGTLKVQ